MSKVTLGDESSACKKDTPTHTHTRVTDKEDVRGLKPKSRSRIYTHSWTPTEDWQSLSKSLLSIMFIVY